MNKKKRLKDSLAKNKNKIKYSWDKKKKNKQCSDVLNQNILCLAQHLI